MSGRYSVSKNVESKKLLCFVIFAFTACSASSEYAFVLEWVRARTQRVCAHCYYELRTYRIHAPDYVRLLLNTYIHTNTHMDTYIWQLLFEQYKKLMTATQNLSSILSFSYIRLWIVSGRKITPKKWNMKMNAYWNWYFQTACQVKHNSLLPNLMIHIAMHL